MKYDLLVAEARNALQKAYAPYSKFKVGAALLAKSGKIYSGANIENAIYRATHAEKFALDTAVFNGEKEFEAIAVAVDGKPAFPCGQCLQDLTEFDDGKLVVLATNLERVVEKSTLAKLFPKRFGPKNLK